jgi:UrcA family protein
MKNLTTLVAVATFAVCSFTAARADSAFEPRSVSVRFADLDTTNVQGAAVLYGRLKSAAESVCKELDSPRDLGLMQRYAACIHLALGNAIATIDRPAVTAYAVAHGALSMEAPIKIASNK